MKNRLIGFIRGQWGQRILILVLIFIIMGILQPKFFTPSNASSILLAISVYGIMACGMLFVVLIGGLDLSVGSMAGLAGTIFALFARDSGFSAGGILAGVILALLAGLLVGYLHGILSTNLGMPSFIVTLATKYILYGITPMLTAGAFVFLKGKGFVYQLGNAKLLGIPLPIVLFIVVAIICGFVLRKTTFGRRLYAVGGNPSASTLLGIRVFRDAQIAYVICSVLACIGGMILTSMNMMAGQTTGIGYEGYVLLAMIVGGINLAGGEGGIAGAVFGALLAGMITNMMTLLGVSPDFQKFVQGAIILVAISLNVLTNKIKPVATLKQSDIDTEA
jgi:ribose/xylose/arabinose/galactoside ABC-type transport system permease subunit